MNEDNLNMEIRKFLKKVGITSQRILEKKITKAESTGILNTGEELELFMTLSIRSKSINSDDKITGIIKID